MTIYRYTTMEVKDLPYPEGLGKSEYRDLELAMRRLLGDSWDDQATNERLFWTPAYQNLINTLLKPRFDRFGDIVTIAAQAATVALSSSAFDTDITGTSTEAQARYRAGLPPALDLTDRYGPIVTWWIIDPPRIHWEGPTLGVSDGRHRFSLLRSIVEPRDPTFPVLVEISR